jgi:hypothetical protein
LLAFVLINLLRNTIEGGVLQKRETGTEKEIGIRIGIEIETETGRGTVKGKESMMVTSTGMYQNHVAS